MGEQGDNMLCCSLHVVRIDERQLHGYGLRLRMHGGGNPLETYPGGRWKVTSGAILNQMLYEIQYVLGVSFATDLVRVI